MHLNREVFTLPRRLLDTFHKVYDIQYIRNYNNRAFNVLLSVFPISGNYFFVKFTKFLIVSGSVYFHNFILSKTLKNILLKWKTSQIKIKTGLLAGVSTPLGLIRIMSKEERRT